MILTLIYNEFVKTIDIDISTKIGCIQEDILNKCGLMIYNIENTEFIIKDKESNNIIYILGSDEGDFNKTLKDFLDSSKINEEDIIKIVVNDRKRDHNGNVIKDNIIIERYTKWLKEYEDANFDASYLNENYSNFSRFNNSHIIRFPLESLLTNILNIPLINIPHNNIRTDSLNDEPEVTDSLNDKPEVADSLNDEPEVTDSLNDKPEVADSLNDEPEVADSLNDEDIPTLQNERINNLRIDTELANISNEYFNIFASRLNEMINNNTNNQLNQESNTRQSTLNMFDNLIRNINEIPVINNNFNNFYNFDNLNNFYNLNNLDNLNSFDSFDSFENFYVNTSIITNFDSLNTDILQEDVKIILSEEEFDEIESDEYIKKSDNNSLECMICTEYFAETDIFKKLKCNHVFHTDCIKPWLCEESHKCPICRVDVGKGIIKN